MWLTTCFTFAKQSLADRPKGRVDLLKDAAATELLVVELEEELMQVHETVATDNKRLENELVEERIKTREANSQFNAANIGKIDFLTSFSSSLSCAAEDWTSKFCLYIADFHRREDDLKNELKNTKEKVRSLEVYHRDAEAGAEELKRVMKETIDSEFIVSQKLGYEK
jgi:uroporphyrinogen-III synthase